MPEMPRDAPKLPPEVRRWAEENVVDKDTPPDVPWNYRGRFKPQFHPTEVLPCGCKPPPHPRRELVEMTYSRFFLPDWGTAGQHRGYFIGQCPECRAVHWGEDAGDPGVEVDRREIKP